jgi:hypothetical protein
MKMKELYRILNDLKYDHIESYDKNKETIFFEYIEDENVFKLLKQYIDGNISTIFSVLDIYHKNKLKSTEINEFLNEGYSFEDEKLRFRDSVREPSFVNYNSISNDYDITINNPNLFINWHLGFRVNQQGVEKIIPYIDNVEGTYQVEFHDKHSDELVQHDDKDISEIKWNFSIKPFELAIDKPIYVNSLSFDFNSKTCTVNFS